MTVGSGAKLTAGGAATGLTGGAVTLSSTTNSDALVRVSSGSQIQLSQISPNVSAGTVDVEQGAVVAAPGSITLTATRDTISQGTLESKGSVSLTSARISLGEVTQPEPGLVLTNAQLAALAGVSDLELISQSSIDFYGAVALGWSATGNPVLGSLLLDGSALRGFGSGVAKVNAGTVELTDSQSAPIALPAGTGVGSVQVGGNLIDLGRGSYGFSGFQNVTLASRGDIVATGTSTVTASSNLTLQSNRIIGTGGANLTIDAAGSFDTRSAALDPSLTPQTPRPRSDIHRRRGRDRSWGKFRSAIRRTDPRRGQQRRARVPIGHRTLLGPYGRSRITR